MAKDSLHPDTIIEVVLKKEMSYSSYKLIVENSRKKGWRVQAYQLKIYSDSLNKKIDNHE